MINRGWIDGATGIIFFDRNSPITGTGQITSWSLYAGAAGGSVALLIYHDNGTNWTYAGGSPLETVSATGVNTFTLPSPIAVLPGDIIAFWYPPGTTPSVVGDFLNGATVNNHAWPWDPITAADLSAVYQGTIPALIGSPTFDGTVWDTNTRTYSIAVFGEVTPVPEPVTAWLLLGAVPALGIARRARGRKHA